MSKVPKEEILKIAHLAKLDLTSDELEKYSKEFNDILDYVSEVVNCDVTDIPDEHNLSNYKSTVLEEDKPVEYGLSREEYLKNATEGRSKNGYIVTSKIIDKGD